MRIWSRTAAAALGLVMVTIAHAADRRGASTTVDRPSYSFRYPAAWRMETDDKDYDPDSYFSIDINEGCFLSFFFFDVPIDRQKLLERSAEAQLQKTLKAGAARSDLTRWGSFIGTGALLTGRLKPLGSGTIQIFVSGSSKRTFQVTEFCHDDDLAAAQPGLSLVRSTLKLK